MTPFQGLASLARERPRDPIEYLAGYLLRCQPYHNQKSNQALNLGHLSVVTIQKLHFLQAQTRVWPGWSVEGVLWLDWLVGSLASKRFTFWLVGILAWNPPIWMGMSAISGSRVVGQSTLKLICSSHLWKLLRSFSWSTFTLVWQCDSRSIAQRVMLLKKRIYQITQPIYLVR